MSTEKPSTKTEKILKLPNNKVEPATKSTRKGNSEYHCPYRQSTILQQALAPNKMRVAFFLGAGCPVGIRVPDGEGSKSLIPDISGLTEMVAAELDKTDQFKLAYKTILRRLKSSDSRTINIERVLSHIRALADVVGDGSIEGLDRKLLDNLDEKICQHTTDIVNARLLGDDTPYHHLATWIGGVTRAHAVEVFTSNYDLLLEQALEERRIPYFDGFVGSDQTFFDIASMEQDVLPARWARIWKVHGSVNWWRSPSDNAVRRVRDTLPGYRQMIYPSHLKYDESRRLPYLAMLDRLRAFLSRGQAVLVTCGYSFSDYHLNEIILQGLSGNSNAICFGLMYGSRRNYPDALKEARKQSNFNLLAEDGAVLNTIEADWNPTADEDHPFHGLSVHSETNDSRCKFILGNFVACGKFLTRQLEFRDNTGANTR